MAWLKIMGSAVLSHNRETGLVKPTTIQSRLFIIVTSNAVFSFGEPMASGQWILEGQRKVFFEHANMSNWRLAKWINCIWRKAEKKKMKIGLKSKTATTTTSQWRANIFNENTNPDQFGTHLCRHSLKQNWKWWFLFRSKYHSPSAWSTEMLTWIG